MVNYMKLMLTLNEIIDQLAVANRVCWYCIMLEPMVDVISIYL